MKFDVIDPTTGEYPDLSKIREEPWAKDDWLQNGRFALTDDEFLIIVTPDSRVVVPPADRFKVIFEENIYAVLKHPNAGYLGDAKAVVEAGLELGEKYLVRDVRIGGFSSKVWLKGHHHAFNSVHFEYEDKDGNEIDVYGREEFWDYRTSRQGL